MLDQHQILIVGLGSDILGDDGIGLKIANDLKTLPQLNYIDFKTAMCGGFGLFEDMVGYQSVVFIDATKIGGKPGTVYKYNLDTYQETLHLSNFHELSFKAMFELGKQLNYAVPEHVFVIAIEIEEDKIFDSCLTEKLDQEYHRILEDVRQFVDYELTEFCWMTDVERMLENESC